MVEPRRARHLARPDVLLRGDEAGAGPTVLLLHAGGERRRVWAPVVDILVAAGFRCVTYDQRGHGDSAGPSSALPPHADDVAAMLDAEPPGCVIVGASLGALAAIAALGGPRVRERVAGLVLVDAVPSLDPVRARRYLTAIGMAESHHLLLEDIFARLPRLREITAGLELPMLLVRGGARSPFSDAEIDRFRALAPHATVTRVHDAGHLVAREQPTALADVLLPAVRTMTGAFTATVD